MVDMKEATDIDTYTLTLKTDLADLKTKVDNLEINRLVLLI